MDIAAKYLTSARKYNKNFVDKLRVLVRGGTGGEGKVSNGGVGGKGGDVYLVASQSSKFTLAAFKRKHESQKFVADAGGFGGKKTLTGLKGRSIYIQVPQGVDIFDAETNKLIGSISSANDKLLVARGGKGASYMNKYLSEKGERRLLNFDLKLISDVGFIGFPNAGKSSLLRCLSKAKPVVSPFPFTTIKPEIGWMEFEDHRRISLADLPGIIEGAHRNEGRGHVFLKHAERTKCLLLVADVSGFQLSPSHRPFDCFHTIQILLKEVELFNPTMLKKPLVLAINKIDLPNSTELIEETVEKLQNYEDHIKNLPTKDIPEKMANFQHVVAVSATQRSGVDHLRLAIRNTIDQTKNCSVQIESGQRKMKSNKMLKVV